jgi:1-acyl-sn-glycerol-3-phosphate acyltransferase
MLARATGAPVLPAATDSGLRWGKDAVDKVAGPARVRLYPALEGLGQEALMAALAEVYYERGV